MNRFKNFLNKKRPYYILIPAILFGGFMFVYGEYDDSPGGQLMGLVLAAFGIWGVIKRKKKTPTPPFE